MNDLDYLRQAYQYAKQYSNDPRTQNGSVLTIVGGSRTYGTNRLPLGVLNVPERLTREEKLFWLTHAESDAIFWAAHYGYGTMGATLYCPWAPCADCAKAIVQAGIVMLVAHKEMHDRTPEYWKASIEKGIQILKEGEVEYVQISGKVGGVTNRFADVIWEP